MSRIGKKPVLIPNGVEVKVNENTVTVKGPLGTLTSEFQKSITVKTVDNSIIVERNSDEKKIRAFHGLTRALINNMVIGVSQGFTKTLDLVGIGYRAQMQGKKLVLSLGYSHPVEIPEIDGITIEVPAQNKIIVKGANKETVGQVAAEIRFKRLPEPYKGKGIKYDTEVIKRKVGKAGKK